MEEVQFQESGYCASTGVYHSLYDSSMSSSSPVAFPSSPSLSLPSFLLSHSPAPPSKPAFIDAVSGDTISYSALRALSSSVALSLSSLGVRPRDPVLLVSPNSLQFPPVALGVLSLGALLTTANHLHTHAELSAQVADARPVLIITTQDLSPKLQSLKPIVLIDQLVLTSTNSKQMIASDDINILQDDAATVMYSSGTTGKSKGVVSTHRSLITMSCALRHVWGEGKEEEVYMCVVPMSHMFGFSVFVCGAVAAGATVVVLRRYSVEEVMIAVEEHRVTRLPAVPPMVVQLARAGRKAAAAYDLGSLTEVICSGAPLAREHMERFADGFPGIRLSQCYGLTETSGPITLCDGVKGRLHDSIGRLIPSISAKIVDVRNGKALPPNKYGELCVQGPPVMQGYMNNQEATSLSIDAEGWLHTGDLCFIDMHGLVYVVDRIKELIKYKAYQVAPAELEEALSAHPDVLDVAVIPHPDEEAGEIPMACIVKRSGSKMKEDDVISFMENKVAPYKKIRKVVFVDFLPRSPSGKILRRYLKATHASNQKIEIPARL